MLEDTYDSLIRRTYDNFGLGDLDLLGVVMAQDVVWHEPGRSPLAGDYKGPKAVLGLLGQLKARSGGTFKIEILNVLSEPERAVVLQRETATRNGSFLDVIVALEFEFHQGKVTEVTVYQADTYRFDEFWSDLLGGGASEGASLGEIESPDGGHESEQMDNSDIESELHCSAREASS
jgi:ketosteroid isomerase-like protein